MKRTKSTGLTLNATGSPALSRAGLPSAQPQGAPPRLPASAIAARLIEHVQEAGPNDLVFIARTEGQAEEISTAFKSFMPDALVILLPPWDCLPYDRIHPSRECMGRRASALVAITENAPFRLVVMSPEAALQRIQPVDMIARGFVTLTAGEPLDMEAFRDQLLVSGYLLDDRVDEAGEFTLLGHGLDIFPSAALAPNRILVKDGAIASIRSYDPLTQRTEALVDTIVLAPSTECLPHTIEEAPLAAQSFEARMLGAGVELDKRGALRHVGWDISATGRRPIRPSRGQRHRALSYVPHLFKATKCRAPPEFPDLHARSRKYCRARLTVQSPRNGAKRTFVARSRYRFWALRLRRR